MVTSKTTSKKKKKDVEADRPSRGAPPKRETIDNNGLRKDQNERLNALHFQRGVSVKFILREAIDWYLEALDLGKRLPIINQELEAAEEEQSKDT